MRQAVVWEFLAPHTESTWIATIRSCYLTSHAYNRALVQKFAQLIATQYGKQLKSLQQELCWGFCKADDPRYAASTWRGAEQERMILELNRSSRALLIFSYQSVGHCLLRALITISSRR